MKKILRSGFLLGGLFVCLGINAQTTINTTAVTGFANNNGSGTVTFNFQNNNAYNIIITDIEGLTGTAGANTAELYINTTPINGVPGAISAANGWTLSASQSFVGVANTGSLTTQVFMSGISVVVPANTTVGMAVFAAGQRYHTMVAPNIPLTTVSGGGCNILMGANISYGGGTPPAAPGFSPRGWMGKITFIPAAPCVNPPTAGLATSTKSITCSGESFQLGLSGSSGGTGQTLQWQSSPDNITWTNIAGATTGNYTTSQTTSNYYRCEVTCGVTVSSASVQVTTTATALAGGTYTINGNNVTGGTNFNSFSDFKQAIVCGGIAGPVVVNVVNKGTPYNEQIEFGAISGTSAINTITINGNGQTLTHVGGANYAVLRFNGSEYFKVKNLSIAGSGTASNFAVQLTGNSRFIELDSCTISINQASISSTTAALVVSGSLTAATTAGASARDITVTNCDISGGYYGFTLTGPSAAPFNNHNYIANNTIRDFYLYGMYCGYQDSTSLIGNDINRAQRFGTLSTFYGMYFVGNMTGVKVIGNRIHNNGDQTPTATFTAYSMYMTSANASATSPMLVANNALYELNGSGINYAIYLASGNFINFYHNTVAIDNYLSTTSASAQRAFFSAASSGTFEIKNNLFQLSHVGTGAKHLIYLSSTVPTYAIDYNQYYMNSSSGVNSFGYYSAANVADLAAWKLVNSGAFDASGTYGDAVFNNDFITPQSGVGNNNGTNLLAIVPTDINGIARTATPDKGAVEYVPQTCLQPYNYAATSNQTSISLTWTNSPGADSVLIEYGPSGFTQGTGLTMFADSTALLSGLFLNTCYDIYFTSYCGGSIGNGTGLFSYCTTCSVANLPYVESFNSWPPSCFEITGTSTWTWIFNTAGYAQASFYSYSTGTSTMLTQRVNIDSAAWVRFSWAHLYSATYPDDRLIVRAKATTATNWDTIADLVGPSFSSPNSATTTPPASASDFIEEQIILDPAKFLNQEVDFEIIGLTDFGPHVYIDEFVVEQVPSCLPPFNVTTTGITSSAATANWSSINGTCFNLEYGVQGFIQGTGQGTVVTNVTSPYTITGLNPNSNYQYYIADCCNPNNWAGPFSFKTNCTSQLSGVYTVGGTPSATNFATLDSAIATLTGCGVTGPVTFNLQGGTHVISPAIFGAIVGVNATNTVTINGGGIGVDTISINGSSVALDFDGAQYITIQNVTIWATTVDRPVWLHNAAHHITFDHCDIMGNATTTSSLSSVVAITGTSASLSASGDNANNITVTNCKLSGGYYGFTAYGSSTTSYISNFTLIDNEFVDQYYYAIRFYYVENVTLTRNIANLTRYTFGYGLYAYYVTNATIKQNQFFAPTYGVYMYNANYLAPATTYSEISDNFFGAGTSYGLYLSIPNNVKVYHNSVRGGSYGTYITGAASNVDVRNNIFVSNSTYAAYIVTTPTNFTLDYNIYHTGGASIAYQGAAYTNLAAWKTAQPLYNLNSLQGDPGYVSTTDFHIIGTLPNDAGLNGFSTVDVDGDTRPATGSTTVDIGADEFTPLTWDAALEAILVPMGGCGDSTLEVQAVVKNFGLNTITSLPITVNVTGGVTATLNITSTASLLQGATDTIVVGTINTYAGAAGVNFMGYASLVGDQKSNNDTVTAGPGAYFPYEPQHYPVDTVCANVDSATFAAWNISGVDYGWFANPSDTVPFAEGDSLTFAVNGQQTWYLGYTGSGVQTLVTGYAGGNSCGGGAMFNITAVKTLTITGFDVNTTLTAGSPVPLTVYYIANGTYLGNELNAAAWTTHGSTTATSAGSGNATTEMLSAPLIIPAGTTYAIYLNYASAYTNGNGTNQVVSNADMTINLGVGMCGLFTGSNNPRVFNGGVIYGGEACSNIKVPMTLGVNNDTAVASFTSIVQTNGADVNFNATASAGQTFSWNFGDGMTGTGATATHTYAAGGTYNVCLTVTETNCGTVDSICQTVIATIGLDESLLNQSLNVFPNPSNGKFRIEFQVEGLKNVEVRVSTILGQEIYTNKPGNVSGNYREDIDLSNEATGVYILQIVTDDNVVSRRITIRK